MDSTHASPTLRRELGVFGATMMGLGSIVGTGIFVSIGLAAGVAGPAVMIAIIASALVATCNALSSAQLAACHPVSGGTYEYGYRYLNPPLGFSAGWMFLCAKSASAATAALGFSGYLLNMLGLTQHGLMIGVALASIVTLTGIVLYGIRQSNRANIAIVSVTVISLVFFVIAGLPTASSMGSMHLKSYENTDAESDFWPSLLQATALMFVAFTGYGRIATLGEEVHEPRRTIPRAIVITLWLSAALYVAVALVAVASVGAGTLSQFTSSQAAPLESAARHFKTTWAAPLVAIGAMTAMLGVLLNLILGLSRVMLAMGRRGDMPHAVARLNRNATPFIAIMVIGVIVLLLALIGDIKSTWSFSAFTVLIYYAITNLAAIKLSDADRLYPRWISLIGLFACLALAFWVEMRIWLIGCGILAIGLLLHWLAHKLGLSRMNQAGNTQSH